MISEHSVFHPSLDLGVFRFSGVALVAAGRLSCPVLPISIAVFSGPGSF
jgi:hypothetical protein